MITAYSAAINGGYLVTPQVVNSITDENGNIVKKMDTVVRRQVISEDTSASMREILEGVVEGQPGSNCYIKGYRIGGKSGTSQKMDEDSTGQTYVSSYCAFAPADDPEIVMLVMVDHPTGEKFYGSQVAAPICVNVLSAIKNSASGKVKCLFGCGGNRDASKRSLMAAAAADNADFLIVTSDNPRNEDPQDIINDVLVGLEGKTTPYITIVDRREAIHWAIHHAEKDDIIVLAGKGHEDYQILAGGVKIHFDEREVVADALKELEAEGR